MNALYTCVTSPCRTILSWFLFAVSILFPTGIDTHNQCSKCPRFIECDFSLIMAYTSPQFIIQHQFLSSNQWEDYYQWRDRVLRGLIVWVQIFGLLYSSTDLIEGAKLYPICPAICNHFNQSMHSFSSFLTINSNYDACSVQHVDNLTLDALSYFISIPGWGTLGFFSF
jgi:hypothetical protein